MSTVCQLSVGRNSWGSFAAPERVGPCTLVWACSRASWFSQSARSRFRRATMSGCAAARLVVSDGSSCRLTRNDPLIRPRGALGGVVHVVEQLPVALAHGPARVDLPVQDVVGRRCIGRLGSPATRLLPSSGTLRRRDAAQLGDRRQPVAAVGDLCADLVLRQVSRPAHDRRHADAALEQAELGPAIDARRCRRRRRRAPRSNGRGRTGRSRSSARAGRGRRARRSAGRSARPSSRGTRRTGCAGISGRRNGRATSGSPW